LSPITPVQRRRHPARSGRVRPEREGDEAARDGDARAGGGPARHDPGIERVPGHGEGRAGAHEPGRELIEIGLTDRQRSRLPQPRHHGGIRRRLVGEGGAGGCRRRAGEVDVVLDRKRHAPERPIRVEGPERPRLRQGQLQRHEMKEDARVARGVDPPPDFCHDRFRLEAAGIGRA
jgi:hypothetical protein